MFEMVRSRLAAPLAPALALIVGACGAGASSSDDEDVRTIEVTALDSFRFEPSVVTVSATESVRFVVINEGQLQHEFLLGTEEEQEAAEAAGEHEGGHAGAEFDVVVVEPGQREETIVTIKDHDPLLFACHVPGHYEAGMVGTVVVQ